MYVCMYSRHILGSSTISRNDSHRLKLCRLSCTSITNTPHSKVRLSAVFWGCGNPLRRNSETFHRYPHAETDLRLLFRKWSKSVQDKWPKGHFVLVTEKHVLVSLGRTPRRFSPFFFCQCAPWPLTYNSGFIQKNWV